MVIGVAIYYRNSTPRAVTSLFRTRSWMSLTSLFDKDLKLVKSEKDMPLHGSIVGSVT
jgi:hypothetical protein